MPFDAGAGVGQRARDPVHARPYRGTGRDERVVVEDEDAEVAEPVVAGGRQGQAVGHAERQRVRATMTSSRRVRSRALRAIGPTTARSGSAGYGGAVGGTMPRLGARPRVGLWA